MEGHSSAAPAIFASAKTSRSRPGCHPPRDVLTRTLLRLSYRTTQDVSYASCPTDTLQRYSGRAASGRAIYASARAIGAASQVASVSTSSGDDVPSGPEREPTHPTTPPAPCSSFGHLPPLRVIRVEGALPALSSHERRALLLFSVFYHVWAEAPDARRARSRRPLRESRSFCERHTVGGSSSARPLSAIGVCDETPASAHARASFA